MAPPAVYTHFPGVNEEWGALEIFPAGKGVSSGRSAAYVPPQCSRSIAVVRLQSSRVGDAWGGAVIMPGDGHATSQLGRPKRWRSSLGAMDAGTAYGWLPPFLLASSLNALVRRLPAPASSRGSSLGVGGGWLKGRVEHLSPSEPLPVPPHRVVKEHPSAP